MTPEAATQPERFHAFDSLRGGAMLLGVFFHASLAYVDPPQTYWIVQDESRHLLFGVFAWASHSFRMQLFFVMAGFFARLLLERYGTTRFLRQRSVRLGVPFVVGLCLDNAIQQTFLHTTYATGLIVPAAASQLAKAAAPLDWSSYVQHFTLGIYWFLEYLICLTAIGTLVWLSASARAPNFDRSLSGLVTSRWRAVWLAIPTAIILFPNGQWGVGSPAGLLPELGWLVYYGVFFGFGWALHRRRELLETFAPRYRAEFAMALAVGMLALGVSAVGHLGALPPSPPLRALALLSTSVFTWSTLFGFMGLALVVFDRERASVRYVSDSAYWLYLTHDYWVMGLQLLLAPLLLGAFFKYGLVVGGALLVLFATYEVGVRYTFVGAILNGRKRRPGTQLVPTTS